MNRTLRSEGESVHVRRVRSDKGSVHLTERDVASLRWIGEQYAIRLDQLSRLLGRDSGRVLTESTARAAVSRWVRAGLAKSRKITVREPVFVWLTRRGLHEMGLGFKGWEPAAATAGHLYWTNQVRLYVESRHPGCSWRSERQLRAGEGMQTVADGAAHVADGEVHAPGGIAAIEVELTSKSVPRREAIMELLTERYPTVWYFAPPAVLTCLERGAKRLESGDRLRFYPLERVA